MRTNFFFFEINNFKKDLLNNCELQFSAPCSLNGKRLYLQKSKNNLILVIKIYFFKDLLDKFEPLFSQSNSILKLSFLVKILSP